MKDDKVPGKPLDEQDIFLPVETTLELSELIDEDKLQAGFVGTTGPEPLPTMGPAIEEVTDNVSVHEADILLKGYLAMERRTKSKLGEKVARQSQPEKSGRLRLDGVPRNQRLARPETGQRRPPAIEHRSKPEQEQKVLLQTPTSESKSTRKQAQQRTERKPITDTSDWPVLDADAGIVTTSPPSKSELNWKSATAPSKKKTPTQPSLVPVKPGPRKKAPAADKLKTPRKPLKKAPPQEKQNTRSKPVPSATLDNKLKAKPLPTEKAQPTRRAHPAGGKMEPLPVGTQKPPSVSVRRTTRPVKQDPKRVPTPSRPRPSDLRSARFEPQDAPTLESPRTQAEKLKQQFGVPSEEEPTKVVDHKKTLEIFKEFAATQRPTKDK